MAFPVDVTTDTYDWLMFGATAAAALGTIAATVVAVVLARGEQRARVAAEQELRKYRERERRSEAARVIVKVWPSHVQDPVTNRIHSIVNVDVRNDSSAPIRHVRADVRSIHPPAEFHLGPVPLIAAGERHETSSGARDGELDALAFEVSFVDASGSKWRMDERGDIRELDDSGAP